MKENVSKDNLLKTLEDFEWNSFTIEEQVTEFERTPYNTERYWELFTEDREGQIAYLKEELHENLDEFNNLNPDDEFFETDRELLLWEIEDSSGWLLVREWELHYRYDSEVEMGNDEVEDHWLNKLMSVLVVESNYQRVRELLSKAMKEFPKNPVRALARIPAWLREEGELSLEWTVEIITRLTPYMSEVKE